MSADIDALYKNARAVLWVEDAETRAWLHAVWSGSAPTVSVLIAGNRNSVEAMCKQAVELGHRHVFGLVDQDFGTTNRSKWTSLSPPERVYRLDVHEVENLLLDARALAECPFNVKARTQGDIEAKINASAGTRLWWVACCRFLAKTHADALAGYPSEPASLTSLVEAQSYVAGSIWFSATAAQCPHLASAATVTTELTAAHTLATTELANGSWRATFPGKQLFREIGAYVYQNGKGPAARLDLVKAIGEWQLQSAAIPAQAVDLRSSILARV